MLRRIVPATAAAALLITGLTGCAASNDAVASCESPYSAGALSDSVVVSGPVGERPTAEMSGDISIKTTQRTIETQSTDDDAAVVTADSLVGVNINLFDAKSGEQVYSSAGYDTGAPEYLVVSDTQPNPLADGLRCAAEGDRVVIALSPDESALFAQQLGAPAEGSLVFVVDIVSVAPLSSEGSPKALPSGFPAVVTNDKGQPGIVLPPNSAPNGVTSAVRIQGDGPTVAATDNLVVQVLEVDWDGTVKLNSWETGPMGIGNEAESVQAGTTYRTALTGKNVGSQVVVLEKQGEVERAVVVDILAIL